MLVSSVVIRLRIERRLTNNASILTTRSYHNPYCCQQLAFKKIFNNSTGSFSQHKLLKKVILADNNAVCNPSFSRWYMVFSIWSLVTGAAGGGIFLKNEVIFREILKK
jgi:hypothetical protein